MLDLLAPVLVSLHGVGGGRYSSSRAIAPVVGANQATVVRDMQSSDANASDAPRTVARDIASATFAADAPRAYVGRTVGMTPLSAGTSSSPRLHGRHADGGKFPKLGKIVPAPTRAAPLLTSTRCREQRCSGTAWGAVGAYGPPLLGPHGYAAGTQ